MFVVPSDTPGVNIIRNVAVFGHDDGGTHSYIRYDNVRIPRPSTRATGEGYVAQTRLGGGRSATRCARSVS